MSQLTLERELARALGERNEARAERDALSDVLRAIHAELDGTEWDADTCDRIANIVRDVETEEEENDLPVCTGCLDEIPEGAARYSDGPDRGTDVHCHACHEIGGAS